MNLKKEDLIKGAWQQKTLGDVTEIYFGDQVSEAQLKTGDYPAVSWADLNDSLPQEFTECVSFVDHNLITKKKYFEKGDILISTKSFKRESVGKCSIYLSEERPLAGKDIGVIKVKDTDTINPKYLNHFLSSSYARERIEDLAKGSAVFHLYPKEIKQIKLLVPPLVVQDKIVDYLSNFSELTRELGLILRKLKKRFHYYKDVIFEKEINKSNWELKTLGEIASEIVAGNSVRADQIGNLGCPVIRGEDIHNSNIYIEQVTNSINPKILKTVRCVEKGYLLMAKRCKQSEDFEVFCVYAGEQKAFLNSDTVAIKHNQNPSYLAYACSSKFVKEQIPDKSRRYIPKSHLLKINIQLLSFEEQEKAAKKLDALYTETKDMNESIVALMQGIQKKYEYCKEEILKMDLTGNH